MNFYDAVSEHLHGDLSLLAVLDVEDMFSLGHASLADLWTASPFPL